MLNLVRPRHFVPVHGEYRHLVRHLQLAREVGVPADGCHLLEDGDVLEIDGARRRGAPSACRRGASSSTARASATSGDVVLRDRRHLSEDGLVLAVLAIAQQSGELVAGPGSGVARRRRRGGEPPRSSRARAARSSRRSTAINPESRTDPAEVKEEVRKALRRYFKRLDRRPVILPFVLEM